MNKKIKAIECIQNNSHFYLSKLDSDTLKDICFISRTEQDPKIGFQRHLNESRSRDIAHYLDENKGVIPSPLIISAQKDANFSYDEKTFEISFDIKKRTFLVIDGQHRLFGFYQSQIKYEVPIVIFAGIDLQREVSLFIDINTTQKGVPTSLLLAIRQLTGRETSVEEILRKLFDMLDKESPLSGMLSSTKSVTGKISRAAFNESLKVILQYGPLSNRDIDLIYNGINNYLKAFEVIFEMSQSNARINKTLYFKAIFEIFNEAVTKCLNEKGDLKIESLVDTMKPLTKIEFDNYSGTSYQTQNKLVQEMRVELNRFDKISTSLF